jgi:glycosyltransferase involved in cell wall biosynthesis
MTMVSLVIPLHQGERFIAAAIASVREQDDPPREVIVVDDGSTDAGPSIVEAMEGVVLLRQEQRGPGAARNRGIEAATGELIAFLDQDDVLRPAALRRHRETLDAHPEAMLSVCRQRFAMLDGEIVPEWQRPDLLDRETIAWTPSCLCIRRAAFEQIGLFDESLRATSDLLWCREFRGRGLPFIELEETLVDRRVHARCQSGDGATIRREMLEVFRRAAASRRREAP